MYRVMNTDVSIAFNLIYQLVRTIEQTPKHQYSFKVLKIFYFYSVD